MPRFTIKDFLIHSWIILKKVYKQIEWLHMILKTYQLSPEFGCNFIICQIVFQNFSKKDHSGVIYFMFSRFFLFCKGQLIISLVAAEVFITGFFMSKNSKMYRMISECGQKLEKLSNLIWQMLKLQQKSK